jgi:lipopolysaccharide export system permease protein
MPASNATFDEYEFNIDISSIVGDDSLNDENLTKRQNMLSLKQLNDTIPDLKSRYDETIALRAKNIFINTSANQLYKYPDSIKKENINPRVLNNFEVQEQINILNTSVSKTNRVLSSITNNMTAIKWQRKNLNFFDTEYYNRIAFSLSCLLLFFIGAPLGSIIRKGGFGLPMILAISVYVIYFFANTFGKNLAEESSISAFLGGWISAFIMIPLAILLTRRATRDKGLFNIDSIIQPIINIFKKFTSKKTQ